MYLKAGTKGIDKMDCRWSQGIWLGMRDESPESIIGTAHGCIKAKDIRRLGRPEDRWNLSDFNAFTGVPWEPIPGSGTTSLKVNVRVPRISEDFSQPPAARRREVTVRRFRINRLYYFLNS